MAGQINTYTLPQLTDLIVRSYQDALQSLSQDMKNSGIVIDDTLAMKTWVYKRFAERIHRDQYASARPEWDIARMGKVQYGYEKDATVTTVAKEISITKLMRIAGKNKEMMDQITTLTDVCPNTIDLDLAHRLTFHTATTYTNRDGQTIDIKVGDGLALASASHTLTGSATTYNNIITGNPQFSKWALENAEKLFVEETLNNFGEKMLMEPDTIITTDDRNTINQVKELLHATANVDSSNAGTFNVYQAKYKHVIIRRIATTAVGAVDSTKKKYWFLASSKDADFYLVNLEQPYIKTPADGNNGEDFSSESRKYLCGATYGIAIVTGRWIKCSTGLWS